MLQSKLHRGAKLDSCSQAPKHIRFGLFEADFAAGELRKHGRTVKLQEQPFQVLALLIQRAGQVVSREDLQKALWPANTFVEFDQAVNTAVRKIRQALGDSAENPRFIETLPRKGYRFIAPVATLETTIPSETAIPSAGPAQSRSARYPFYWLLAVSLIGVITAIAGWVAGTRNTSQPISALPVPLTSYPGQEMQASFSPDANQVAFVWDGEKQNNFDIYTKLTGSESLLRLTKDPAPDFSPAWSPDGRSIAFLRTIGPAQTGVFLVPAIGGAERKLADINYGQVQMDVDLAWSPDGKWLATVDRIKPGEKPGLILLSPEDGEKRRLTFPPTGWGRDGNPAFSPDGRRLAFMRGGANAGKRELFLVSLSSEGNPKDKPVQVTFYNRWSRTPVWSPDGREIVFSSGYWGGDSWLWRVSVPIAGPAERIAVLGDMASEPAIAPRSHRMAYTRSTYRLNTWRVMLSGTETEAGPATKLLSSTRVDYNAQYSPDGKRIVFHSTRSGASEVWVCDRDGSNARQLTFLQAPLTGSPRWSPDGAQIVFDSNVEGQFEVYTIGADGGKPRRLTFNSAADGVPSWSWDGKWIYFTSSRTGEYQVWKMPAQGGNAIQVTRHGGYVAFESPDRRFVYYSKTSGETSLWRVPVNGSEERQVLESVRWLNFAVVPNGIYFVPGADSSIRFFSFHTGASTLVAPIQGTPSHGLSLSPDGRQILYSQIDQQSSDLMLVENFR